MKQGAVIWLCGLAGSGKSTLALNLARLLREKMDNVIYLDGDELREIFEHFSYDKQGRLQMAFKRAKMANFLSQQGQIVIVSTISLFNESYEFNKRHLKNYFEIFVECEFDEIVRRNQKGLYSQKFKNVVGVDIAFDLPKPNVTVNNSTKDKLDEKTQFLFDEFMKFYSTVSLNSKKKGK